MDKINIYSIESIKASQIERLSFGSYESDNIKDIRNFRQYYLDEQGQESFDKYMVRCNALKSYDDFIQFLLTESVGFKINAFTHHLVTECIKDIDSRDEVEYFTHTDVLHFLNGGDTSHIFNKNWGSNLANFYTKACIIVQNMIDSIHYIDNEPYVTIPAKLIKQTLGSAQRGYAFDKNLVLNALRRIEYIDEHTVINNNGTHYHLTNKYNSKLTHRSWFIYGPIVGRWNHKLLKSVTDDELYNIYGLMTFEPTNKDYFDALKFIDQYTKGTVDDDLDKKFSGSYYQAQLTVAFKEKDFMMLAHHKVSKKCGRRFTQLTAYKGELRKKMYTTSGTPTIEVDLCASQASQLYNMIQATKLNHETPIAKFLRNMMLNYYLKNGMDSNLQYMAHIHNQVNHARLNTLPIDKELKKDDVNAWYNALKDLHERSRSMGNTQSGRSSVYLKGAMDFNSAHYWYKDTQFVNLNDINYLELCDYFINTMHQIDVKEWNYMSHRYNKYNNDLVKSTRNTIIFGTDKELDKFKIDQNLVDDLDKLLKLYTKNKYNLNWDCENLFKLTADDIRERMSKLGFSDINDAQYTIDTCKNKQVTLQQMLEEFKENGRDFSMIKTSLEVCLDYINRASEYIDLNHRLDQMMAEGADEIFDSYSSIAQLKQRIEMIKKSLSMYERYSDDWLDINIKNKEDLITANPNMPPMTYQMLNELKKVKAYRKELPKLESQLQECKSINDSMWIDKKNVMKDLHDHMQYLINKYKLTSYQYPTDITGRCYRYWKSNTTEFGKLVTATYDKNYWLNNDFYFNLCDRGWEHNVPIFLNNGNNWDRNKIKKLFCRVVYGNKYMYENNKDDDFNRITKALGSIDNGELLKLINTYKYNGWNLAVDVMRTETYFMNLVWKRLKNLGIVYSSIHDSIKTAYTNHKVVDNTIINIAQILGFGYNTKYEF